MTANFYIGQIFEGEYPPEAAIWCNENGSAFLEELDLVDGVRRYEIKSIPDPTDEELVALEKEEIKAELDAIDLKSIRALRAGDTEYIELYENKAVELRARLAEIDV